MKVLIIDDEPIVLMDEKRIIHEALQKNYPELEIEIDTAVNRKTAIAQIQKTAYELIFTDIDLPGIKGIALSKEIEGILPNTNLFFATGFPNYSLDAWETFACGFLLKPLTVQGIENALKKIKNPIAQAEQSKVKIQCFGAFEVSYLGEPVVFARKKSMEMLAVLVDALGCDTEVDRIRVFLWEEDEDNDEKKAYVRQLARDIRNTFSSYGIENILINTVGGYKLNKALIECDYFDYVERAEKVRPLVYMSQYDWAELWGDN